MGILWLNAAETWIDVEKQSGSILNFVSGGFTDGVNTHWISESGIIDVFFYLGPRPKDIMRQNALITGSTPLPQVGSGSIIIAVLPFMELQSF